MNKYLIGAVFALSAFSPLFSEASTTGLDSNQVSAILQLLQSFGADQSVISNVQETLTGTPTTVRDTPSYTPSYNTSVNTGSAFVSNTYSEKDVGFLTAVLYSKIATVKGPRYKSGTATDEVNQEIQVARQRRQAMSQLAETDPTAFLKNVMSETTRSRLPMAVQAEIEQKVTLTGTIEVLHIDDFTNRTNSKFKYFLKSGGSRLSLKTAGDPPAMRSGSSVRINGYQLGQDIVANGTQDGVSVLSQPAPEAVGVQRTLAVLLTSSGYPAVPPQAQIRTAIFAGDFEKYFEEQSYGKVSFTGDVTDWISIAPYSGYCYVSVNTGINLETPAIRDYFIQNKINLSQYDRLVFVLNNTGGGCSGVGKSDYSFNGTTYRFSESWVGWPNPGYTGGGTLPDFGYVLSHEMGHALGVNHAKSWNCTGPSLDVNCQDYEYGNTFDVMGSGEYTEHFNAFYKNLFGWLDSSSKISIAQNGSYTLAPIEAQTGVRAGIVTNPSLPLLAPLYIEFRQPIGFDRGLAPASAGLQLNQVIEPSPFTRLINANYITNQCQPNQYGPPMCNKENWPLMPSGNFAWSSHGISISSLATTPSSAEFDIGITQPRCDRNGFSISVMDYPKKMATNSSGNFNLKVINNDTVACNSSTMELGVTITNSNGWNISKYPEEKITIAPGEMQYAFVSFLPSVTTTPGDRIIDVTVFDSTNGRTYSEERSFTVTERPTITDINPSSGKAGTAVTLRGTGFNEFPETNTLYINDAGGTGLSASLRKLSAKAGELTFSFPTLMGNYKIGSEVPPPLGPYTVTLVRDDDFGSALATFTVTEGTSTTDPTASLTLNVVGRSPSRSLLNLPNDIHVDADWSSKNGTSYIAKYDAYPTVPGIACANPQKGASWTWIENPTAPSTSAKGSFRDQNMGTVFAGCTVVITYTVTGVKGTPAIDTVMMTLAPLNTPLPIITVTSPNGNAWLLGSTQTIQWTDSSGASNVKYTVFVGQKNGNSYGYGVIADNVSGTSVGWTVGTLANGTKLPPLVPGESAYYIQVARQTPPPASSFATTPNASFSVSTDASSIPPGSTPVIVPPTVPGVWSNWSACSASCGGGIQTRGCMSTGASDSAAYCSGASSQSCNTQACAPNIQPAPVTIPADTSPVPSYIPPASPIIPTVRGADSSASAIIGMNRIINQLSPVAPATFSYTWTHNLQIGSPYTDDIIALQTALTKEGIYTGEITGGFYNQTYVAVKAFQEKYGIDYGINAAGFVGSKTRAKLNALY